MESGSADTISLIEYFSEPRSDDLLGSNDHSSQDMMHLVEKYSNFYFTGKVNKETDGVKPSSKFTVVSAVYSLCKNYLTDVLDSDRSHGWAGSSYFG